ncbi:MAG: hypothetical protein OEW05_04455 [Candidatus Aminicenantes bacterium]|nr:hypothetical protein [Candidatus Aminicenantes bacterium]
MKRKGLWGLLAVLGCGALVQLAVSASQSQPGFSAEKLAEFRSQIKAKREALATWLNESTGDMTDVIEEYAVAVDQKGKTTGRGRDKVETKWKRIKTDHGARKIKFDISDIQLVPANYMAQGEGATWMKHNCIAVEFGTFTFLSKSEAESGPSAALPQPDGEYLAIWGHKEDCPWGIVVEIEY